MVLRRLVPVILLSILVAGCRGPRPRGGDSLDDPVLSNLRKDLATAIEAAVERQCLRPVLRGQALPGSADADSLALWEPGKDLKACLDGVAALTAPELAWLENPAGPVPPVIPALARVCAPLREGFRKAAGHEDSCSPYLVGRRPALPSSSLVPQRLAKAALALARDDVAQGRPGDAADLLLDAARVFQDLFRGEGAPWQTVRHGAVGSTILLRWGVGGLLSDPGLPGDVRDRLARGLEALAATVPTPGETLAALGIGMAAHVYLPVLKPGWTPPGGLDPALEKDRSATTDRAKVLEDWKKADLRGREVRAACPPGRTVRQCAEGLRNATAIDDRGVLLSSLPQMNVVPFLVAAARVQARASGRGACPSTADLPAWGVPADLGVAAVPVEGGVDLRLVGDAFGAAPGWPVSCAARSPAPSPAGSR